MKILGSIDIIKKEKDSKLQSLTLRQGMSEGMIWIELEDGEGGDFDASELFDLIMKFYKEKF